MNASNSIGLIYGPSSHYLDHIAPLCAALKMPLMVTEEDIAHEASAHYPDVEVLLASAIEAPHHIAKTYKCVFSSLPKPLFDEIFFIAENLYHNKLLSIWCPHGNSDKGNIEPFFESLAKDKLALVYGDQMIGRFKDAGIYDAFYALIPTGNYRLAYATKHKSFYSSLISAKISKGRRTYLYAPTWNDSEDSSSYNAAISPLMENLPDEDILIVKPHPNLLIQEHMNVLRLIGKKPNVHFLLDFSPIYPLLSQIDVYIGDMSSIGYDFLHFDKPMCFLQKAPRNGQLLACGIQLSTKEISTIYQTIEKALPHDFELFSDKRHALTQKVFGKAKSPNIFRKQVHSICNTYLEEEP